MGAGRVSRWIVDAGEAVSHDSASLTHLLMHKSRAATCVIFLFAQHLLLDFSGTCENIASTHKSYAFATFLNVHTQKSHKGFKTNCLITPLKSSGFDIQ